MVRSAALSVIIGISCVAGVGAAQESEAHSESESGAEVPLGERAFHLELALEEAHAGLDGLSVIATIRSATTGVFETFCAANGMIPGPNGYEALGLGVGIGCLIGATTLFWLTARRIAELGDPPEAAERLARYRAARRASLDEATILTFERELEHAAAGDRFRRASSVVLGLLTFVASGILAGLTAAGEIEKPVGVSISITTALIGGLSTLAALVDGPAESALARYRAR